MRMRFLLLYLALLAWPVRVCAETPYLVTTLYNEVKSSEIKCRQGDDPAWAQPELYDDSWRRLDSVAIDELKDIWWFRLKVKYDWSEGRDLLEPALSLLIFPGTAYELYANGKLVAKVGITPGRAEDSAWARVHPLPKEHETTLALRVWYQPDFGGQLHRIRKIPKVKLGNYFHLQTDRANEIKDYKLSRIPSYALAFTFLIVGLYHLNLYTRNRKLPEYLWFGFFSISFSLNTVAAHLWRAELTSYHGWMLLLRLSICLVTVLCIQFLLKLLKLPITLPIKVHYAFTLTLFLVFLLGSNETLIGSTGNLFYATQLIYTIAVVFWLIFGKSSRHNTDLAPLRVAFLIMAGLQVLVIARVAVPIPDYIDRLMLELPSVGFATLVFTMGITLSNRFLKVYNEVEALNRDLERKVQERTEEISRQRDEIEEKNQRILDSITYAESLQKTILPETELLQAYNSEVFIFYRPKDIVSGDFYYFQKTETGLILAVLDCTGHGIAGAMMSMVAESLLSQVIVEKGTTDPQEILRVLDERLHRASSSRSGMEWIGMEAAICLIDDQCLRFAGAGRPLYYTNRRRELIAIKGTSKMLGSKRGASNFHSHAIPASEIDMLYLTTDGYADQNGDFTPKYGSKRFQDYLKKISSLPANIQYQLLEDEFDSFKGMQSQRDDVTVLGLRLSKNGSKRDI